MTWKHLWRQRLALIIHLCTALINPKSKMHNHFSQWPWSIHLLWHGQWGKFVSSQDIVPVVIIFSILMTFLFEKAVIMWRIIACWSKILIKKMKWFSQQLNLSTLLCITTLEHNYAQHYACLSNLPYSFSLINSSGGWMISHNSSMPNRKHHRKVMDKI